ncbi:MAG: radical SAM protein [Muribaculaceae bacterium]|nr:radical SAM protein [Muribaculaceae bacterium]
MQRVLFHQTIFGPIHSRRLGASLGVNLSPTDGKVCSFDCLYCEAGYNAQGPGTSGLPSRETVASQLEEKLRTMSAEGAALDVITFSGNGEPTMHPDFAGIIDDTIALRDKYYPEVKISVLTNSTRLYKDDVAKALRRVDNNIMKLDSANGHTVALLDRPVDKRYRVDDIIEQIAGFGREGIVQTMITRGVHNGIAVDNTTEEEIAGLIAAYKKIMPREVMIYTIDRKTPEQSLQRVSLDELKSIADRITRETGLTVQVSG